ncbi:ATP-binding protein [Neobacillus pocheonensis]|uniref:ATP-binding protein n=1 Tax=Neobacillus pocheonensis TaxID=363869 RepID=UPI003D2DAD19
MSVFGIISYIMAIGRQLKCGKLYKGFISSFFYYDDYTFVMMLNYAIISIPFYYLRDWYKQSSLSRKLSIAFLFYLVISITRFIAIYNLNRSDHFFYLLLFSIISYISLAFVIYLIEINELQLFFMQRLQHAEKLNSISQLAASVAHEIRNPMTTIRGFMQLLRDSKNLTPDHNMFVGISLDELNRTQTIIDDFLSLARPNTNENQMVNISILLREITDFMRPYAMISGTEILTEINDHLMIKCSPHEFKQLILNLMKNGIEAMPKGGQLKVKATSEGPSIIIIIQDEGIGLTESQLKRLGQPYYSTKSRGTGLGLLISYDILKRMQGKVRIDSKENVGTKFMLIIPKQPPYPM